MSQENSLCLPDNMLPDCWNDEVRINVLYAPFRNRSVNPQDFDSKLAFWKNLITKYCTHNKVYTFTITDLLKIFNRNGRSPSCLSVVVEEMYKSGELQTTEQFAHIPSQSWSTWIADSFVKRPFIWSFNKFKNSFISSNKNITYVHLPAVQSGSENVLSLITEEYRNKVIDLHELLSIAKMDVEDVDKIKILLQSLMHRNKLDVKELHNKNKDGVNANSILIKFADKKNKPISDMDISIYILQQNEKMLTNSLEKLENEVLVCITDAKSYLSKGHRQMAKNCLRKKREIEKRINKRANALQNVQIILSNVCDADADVEILESYQHALATLQKCFKETGLTEDSVANTMNELGEVLDIHADIQAALSQPLTADDADLEAELSELIASDQNPTSPKPPSPYKHENDVDTSELEERLKNLQLPLPDVPDNSPILIKNKISL